MSSKFGFSAIVATNTAVMSEPNDEENMKILFPANLSNGECTVLVQIDPEDASTLDFTGATGAIGRLEADDTGGTCDSHFRSLASLLLDLILLTK